MTAHRGRTISNAEFRRLWMDNTISTVEIGKLLGISKSAVRDRALSRGLPPRKRGLTKRANRRVTAEALRPLWDAGVNLAGLAEYFGVQLESIPKAARRLNMPPRNLTRWNSITLEQYRAGMCSPNSDVVIREMWAANVSGAQIASFLGVTKTTVYERAARMGLPKRGLHRGQYTSLDEFTARKLAALMAAEAQKTRVQFRAAEMVDTFSNSAGKPRPARRAA